MSFSDKVSSFLHKASDRLEDTVHKHNAPPPIPYGSKPHGDQSQGRPQVPPRPSTSAAPYWQPDLSRPIQDSFRHELGAHGWGNAESQNYTSSPANSFLSSTGVHVIAISSTQSPTPDGPYTSARLTTHATLSRDRGVIRALITAPVARGIWPAFWLLPADPFSWPGDGEVDIFEAWDGTATNHSCLHWGHFNGEDWNKHRVIETELGGKILAAGNELRAPRFQNQALAQRIGSRPQTPADGAGVLFEFAWWEEAGGKGRLIWYIDGKPVMKAAKPPGTRPMRDFRVLINVAMGGNVCKGRLPDDGSYEMILRDLAMCDDRNGGWEGFERDWRQAPEGHP